MSISKNLYILMLPLCFISCEKTINLKEEDTKSKIVVNAMFSAGDTCKIELSESKAITYNQEIPYLKYATAELLDANNASLGFFTHTTDGNYKMNQPLPLESSTYHLKVSSPGLDDVTATSRTPKPVNFIQWDTITAIADDRIRFDLQFQDEPSEVNYYSISFIRVYLFTDVDLGISYPMTTAPYSSTNEIYVENGKPDFNGENYAEEFFFTDKSFNGELVNFQGFQEYILPEDGTQLVYYVRLNSLSEDLYKYKLSYSNYTNLDGIGKPFSEPISVHSNIENSFGIFGGYSSYSDTIIIN